MKASAKHFQAHAPHAHETQTKLKVVRSSALALNQIGNLEIPFNSLKLIFLDVNARYWLRIFVNSTVVSCSCKLSSISLQVTLSINTIII